MTPPPVYITYFTLKVNDDGSISTFRDVYGHDARIAAALSGKEVAYDQPAKQDNGIVTGQADPRGKRDRQRNNLSNDFTRALFGF